MFSKVLVKLIDEAILPAVTLVAAKVVSAVLIARYYGIEVGVGEGFLTAYYTNAEDMIKINSYSTFAVYFAVFIGGLYFLLKSRLFHDTHVSPHFAARLFSLRIGNLIETSFDIYSQGTIWLSYSYLLTLVCLVQLYFGLLFQPVFFMSLALSVLLTLVFLSDVEREFELK